MSTEVGSIQERWSDFEQALNERIIGQKGLIRGLLVALLAKGHLLVEGAPGLAKTSAIKTLAAHLHLHFHRIQFTPDLLPSDLTGGDIFNVKTQSFEFIPGPLFHELILADEINRASAKVQSALLEAMAERQITVGRETYVLPETFLVMATQNPMEHDGTYPLPKAQLDRFLLQIQLDYPDMEAERAIVALHREERAQAPVAHHLSPNLLLEGQKAARATPLSSALEDYVIRLVMATRDPHRYAPELGPWVEHGVSVRATLALLETSKVHAWLAGHEFVTPADLQAMLGPVLRHRIGVSLAARAQGMGADDILSALVKAIPLP